MSITFFDLQLHRAARGPKQPSEAKDSMKKFIGIFEIRVAQRPQKILQSNLSYNLRSYLIEANIPATSEVTVKQHKYIQGREFSPNANFITANFISAVFQNFP